MDESCPQRLNDDLIRTWSVSEVVPGGAEDCLAVTIRFVSRGLVSPMLHAQLRPGAPALPSIRFLGAGGDFSCFDADGSLRHKAAKQLWIAAGVGVTPFMAMLRGLQTCIAQGGVTGADVAMLLSLREEDLGLANMFKEVAGSQLLSSLKIFATHATAGVENPPPPPQTTSESPCVTTVWRRLAESDVCESANAAPLAGTYVCGPMEFRTAIVGWLAGSGVPADTIYQESFTF
eukprot:gnl/TRDRNA2_/TRDRNA2_119693_c1_seq1.p1 gnl/TRDRNA2_/TRDRNA2_119693_c1~~gnl/TRDRNA2_/TRDRNA2_119693_c1_seq1.p1  ORF type:complete len:233 (-),score=35.85 gnl/TRDRNA2_/TRDRNA2_119693_c1_seq1:20-718(-)